MCNYSVTETKSRLDALIGGLEDRFGEDDLAAAAAPRRMPPACAQHWVGDIGFQGTTARDEDGQRGQAFDVYLRGALGPRAAIARPVFRRVPTRSSTARARARRRLARRTGRRARACACF